ncbi:MAG: glycosyltransferase family 4 protein [Nitrospirae bacterium]|nr:glycosyltransferase family 4 protein [Nitrospirota bacterium]
MNILVCSSLYPNNIWPQHGVFIKERMAHFSKTTGHALKVVAPVPYYPPIKLGSRWLYSQVRRRELLDGIEVYHPRYVIVPKIGMTTYGLSMFLSLLACARNIRRHFDFDLIDAHYVYPDGFAAVLLGLVLGKPVVVSARGSDINLYARMPLIRPLLRFTLRRAAHVVAVSEALKGVMVRLGISPDHSSVIPNGVDARKFSPVPQSEARSRLGLPDGTYLLSVGNLTENKGFHLLLQALHVLRTRHHLTQLGLLIVGDGPLRGELERLCERLDLADQVRFAGRVSHEELHVWYSAADLFCLASGREGWPNVLMEAMACGLPIVATRVGGIPEIVSSEAVGLLARRETQDLVQTILSALQRPWRTDLLRQRAAGFAWSHVTDRLATTFEAACQRPDPLTRKAA